MTKHGKAPILAAIVDEGLCRDCGSQPGPNGRAEYQEEGETLQE